MALLEEIGVIAENMPLDPILSSVRSIYKQCQGVKRNTVECNQIMLMVQELEKALQPIEEKGWNQVSENLNSALLEVKSVLETADELIKKCTNANVVTLTFKSSRYQEEFNNLNKKLNGVLVAVCKALCEQLKERDVNMGQKEDKTAQKDDEMTQKGVDMGQKEDEMTQKGVDMVETAEKGVDMAEKVVDIAQKVVNMAQKVDEMTQEEAGMAQEEDEMAEEEVGMAPEEADMALEEVNMALEEVDMAAGDLTLALEDEGIQNLVSESNCVVL